MKKTLLAVAVGALAVASTASANFYVQGDLGYSKLKVSADEVSLSKARFTPSFAVGYDFGEFRLAVDYTNYGKIKDSYTDVDVVGASEFKAQGFGLSAIYDFNIDSAFQPYVGARLALNHLKLDDHYVEIVNGNPEFNSESWKTTNLGVGVLAGVQYQLVNNLYLNGAVEYNRLGSIDGAKVNQYGAKVGLRYEF